MEKSNKKEVVVNLSLQDNTARVDEMASSPSMTIAKRLSDIEDKETYKGTNKLENIEG